MKINNDTALRKLNNDKPLHHNDKFWCCYSLDSKVVNDAAP